MKSIKSVQPEKTLHSFYGITMGSSITHFEDDITFSASNNRDTVRLHFGLRGDYRFTHVPLNTSYDLVGGHHNMMYSKGIEIIVENKSNLIETFGIELPRSRFLTLVDDMEGAIGAFAADVQRGKPAIFSPIWGSLDLSIQLIIDEIRHHPYEEEFSSIFLYSKCLELLFLCFEQYKSLEVNQSVFTLRKSEEERIIAARDYINEHIDSPPTLFELARIVGLNEYKLKKGFKQTFHASVFSYISERRLHLAKQYLLDSSKTASEIAFDLGYSSPQYFSTSFKKRFGISPNVVRSNP